ncbi:TlpA disulfide reductase family protein [Ideonella sp. DXS22W]|uniref:TlpA disulfide reductase family protein n=1 Tax=Pseudaquabacterium inlustre TaxID=2984192 RepID=A0ABU9CLC4_9BURK
MPHPASPSHPVLPEWDVSTWLNAPASITLASLRGRVVLLHAFQMLCPACVAHGLPQAERVRQDFPADELAVIGLHTVFEHHDVMSVQALQAFIDEYRWSFPIGVDRPDGRGGPSRTMTRYGLRGTPSCIVLDRQGRVQLHHFGRMDDLALGALLGGLIASRPGAEAMPADASASLPGRPDDGACSSAGCIVAEVAR